MVVPAYIQILANKGIAQQYLVKYQHESNKPQPVYLIPVYYFPSEASEAQFLALAQPIVDTLGELLKLSLEDEIGRSIATIISWGRKEKQTLAILQQAAAVPLVSEIKRGFKAFSEQLANLAYDEGLGDILEEGFGADAINKPLTEMKQACHEAAKELKKAITDAKQLIQLLKEQSAEVVPRYKELLLEEYKENYQNETWQRDLEDWIFKYGAIDPTPYSRRMIRDKGTGEVMKTIFTLRDKYFDPLGYFFGLTAGDIKEVKETGILKSTKLGWLSPITLPA